MKVKKLIDITDSNREMYADCVRYAVRVQNYPKPDTLTMKHGISWSTMSHNISELRRGIKNGIAFLMSVERDVDGREYNTTEDLNKFVRYYNNKLGRPCEDEDLKRWIMEYL